MIVAQRWCLRGHTRYSGARGLCHLGGRAANHDVMCFLGMGFG